MKLCIYANCQADGLRHFLLKAHPDWDIRVHRNYQLMLGEQRPSDLLADALDCDVLLYQPTTAFGCKGGAAVPDTDGMADAVYLRGDKAISFAYQFNTGFFPIVKSGRWWTGNRVLVKAAINPEGLLPCYEKDALFYDCARRFAENLAEQSRREEQCTLKFAPFILQNFQTQHLFLLYNHPASALFVEMARAVLRAIDPLADVPIAYTHPNEANLPGWHALHPAVRRELGLTYEAPGGDMEFYRTLIKELAETKGVL